MWRLRGVAALLPFAMLAAPAALAQDAAMKPGQVFRDCAECPEMVVVPAGSFMMGSPASEEGRQSEEGPQHKVTVAKPFAVGRYEVTRDEFARFVQETGHAVGETCITAEGGKAKEGAGLSFRNPGFHQDGRHPVVCVSWDDATAFSAWLSKKTGMTYRLLSEAEWEYAARAGSSTRYHFGGDEMGLCAYDNIADQSLAERFKDWQSIGSCRDGYLNTAPVGSFRPNAFGLHDMHGNVAEWVQDCFNDDYNGAPADGSPWITGDCIVAGLGDPMRVLRGGAWGSRPPFFRSASRYPVPAYFRNDMFGFRVARALLP